MRITSCWIALRAVSSSRGAPMMARALTLTTCPTLTAQARPSFFPPLYLLLSFLYHLGDFLNAPMIQCGTPEQCSECARATFVLSTNDHIQAHLNVRAPLVSSPYVFVVIGCDFAAPVKGIPLSLMSSYPRFLF